MSHAIRQLLEFYHDAGVDCALGDEPQDRFIESQATKLARQQTATTKPTPGTPPHRLAAGASDKLAGMADRRPANTATALPNDETIANARELAKGAATLEELKEALTGFTGCNLKNYAKSTVFADGNPAARLMLIGEAPGRDEDIHGLPFVGRSGQLLDRMLAAIGLDRSLVYIANVIPWRPPGNRTPTPAETELCRPFIERQIELVKPEFLVFIGASSAKTLTGSTSGIMRMRGQWTSYNCGEQSIPAMPIFHPAYLLRSPSQKRLAWQDLLAIKRKMEDDSGTGDG